MTNDDTSWKMVQNLDDMGNSRSPEIFGSVDKRHVLSPSSDRVAWIASAPFAEA
jgi:hypothetical protein